MKTRESNMPEELIWSSFFSPHQVLRELGLSAAVEDAVDFGCGYGTFTIPAAQMVRGTVYGLDIESVMVASARRKAREEGLVNVHVQQRDIVANGTGLPEGGTDYVMLFNILHCRRPGILLREAHRILSSAGRLGIMHWDYDPATPRGPSMDIRPRPEKCRDWARQVGFRLVIPERIDLPPYHYGWLLEKEEKPVLAP